MNVFRANNDSSDGIESLKSELIALGSKSNEDMNIELAGFCHNKTGFILNVTNMERITDNLLDAWRDVVRRRGYDPSLQYDFQDGWVNIRCTRRERKASFLKADHLQILGYISLATVGIYMLWYRRSRMPQK